MNNKYIVKTVPSDNECSFSYIYKFNILNTGTEFNEVIVCVANSDEKLFLRRSDRNYMGINLIKKYI